MRLVAVAALLVLAGSVGPAAATPAPSRATALSPAPSLSPALSLAARWSWPMPAPHTIVRPYLAPATAYSAGHRGIDIAAIAGQPVLAPADGVVHFAGVVVDRPVISLDLGEHVLASFEPVSSTLSASEAVRRGEQIGEVQEGHCPDRVCLHVGARIDGGYVTPLRFLGGASWAVLLPRSTSGRERYG